MFSAKIKHASVFKKIVTILNNLFHTITVQIENNLIRIIMLTACKYMLFDVTLELEEVSGTCLSSSFSIHAKHFLESFNTLRAQNNVYIKIDEGKMTIEIHSNECIERTFLYISKTQCLEFGDEPQYEEAVVIKNPNFQKLCKSFSNTSQELIIRGNSKRITLRANLENIYEREIEFGDKGAVHDDFEDVYYTEHFLNISKIGTLSNDLFFHVKKANPLCIEAKYGNIGSFKVFIKSRELTPPIPE
jgi:hypothetical protein